MKKNLIIAATALLLTTGAVTATVFTNKKPNLAKKEACCMSGQSAECTKKMTAAECEAKKAAGQCPSKASTAVSSEEPQKLDRTHCFD